MMIIDEIRIIKSILNTHGKKGASIADISDDYFELTGEKWKLRDKSIKEIDNYMKHIDGVYCTKTPTNCVWHINSAKLEHIAKLISQQKTRSPYQRTVRKRNLNKSSESNISNHREKYPVNPRECFFRDNYIYKYSRSTMKCKINDQTRKGVRTTASLNTQLLGDDFFLSLLTDAIQYQANPRKFTKQCRLCESGLTIASATEWIQSVAYIPTESIVINVGTHDILKKKDLNVMINEYEYLLKSCLERNVYPIVTTLAPATMEGTEFQMKIIKFNNKLIERFTPYFPIIDIWSCLVKSKVDCFRPFSEIVSGSTIPLRLWNSEGCDIIMKEIFRFFEKNFTRKKAK